MKRNEVIYRSSACLLCEGKQARLVYRTGEGRYLKCCDCGLVSVDPMATAEQMKNRAEFWANQHHKSVEKVTTHYSSQFQRIAFGDYLQRFERYRSTGRILDIGCGIGGFVDAAQQAGWDSYGVDVSSSAQIPISRGLKVLQSSLEEANFPQDYFDVVTLFDVIEHLPDPKMMIQQAGRVLRPGGCIFLLTPNQGSLLAKILKERWEMVEPEDHLVLYDRRTLGALLAENYFQPARSYTIDLNVLELKRVFSKQKGLQTRITGQKRRRAFVDLFVKIPALRGVRKMANKVLSMAGVGDKLVVEAVYQKPHASRLEDEGE
jgi:2-polyprenyl-3-methyl-5-hydroxy-6-metoxy-1,4-benzoquinol methylase